MGVDDNGLVFGRYVLLERIAAGGMGEVYVGLQTGIGRFQRPIAVKLLLPHLCDDERLVRMFLREARVGAQMSHANVAQVYDVGLENERYFIAMELVRGVSLSKLVAGLKGANEPLSAELISYVGRCLCEGLHVAHEQKGTDGQPLHLVHRDVTPHNVLVSVDGAVKLTDFGIARVAEGDKLSRPGMVMGKLGYLAPEQMRGQPIDRRVDVFAAGATLYYLAALEKPFDAPTGAMLDPNRLPQAPLRVLRPDLPRALVDAIEQAMHPDVQARFQTAKDFRNALPVPGPDAAEHLGAILRRVCAAALVELEHKTERATRHGADRGVDTVPARPAVKKQPPAAAVAAERSLATPGPEVLRPRRTGLAAALVGVSVALVAGLVWLSRAPPTVEASASAKATTGAGTAGAGPAGAGTASVGTAGVGAVGAGAVGAGAVGAEAAGAGTAGAGTAGTGTVGAETAGAAGAPVGAASAGADPSPPPPPPPLAEAGAGARAPEGGFGFLSIDATPWALVSLDGKALGETPLANVKVSSGSHALVFKNPDTGREVKRRVVVAAGKTVPVRADLR